MPLEVNMSYEIKPGLSIGQIQLGDLKTGDFRSLTNAEFSYINSL